MHLISSIAQSSTDIRLLWLSCFTRMIAFGSSNQILTLYLKSLAISESRIGLFMSLTMIGDCAISYFLTWNANLIGCRRVMRIGSFLMLLAGGVFASGVSNFHALLAASVFGVISPSGGDTGPFKTIEEAVLAKLTPPNHRPEIYAVHGTVGAVGSSLGNFGVGLLVDLLISHYNYTYRSAYRVCFVPFCAISLLKYIIMLFMSSKCEPEYTPEWARVQTEQVQTEQSPLLPNKSVEPETESAELLESTESTHSSHSSSLSPESWSVLLHLLVPFMIDSFGWGFMPTAWVIYYFRFRYSAAASVLGIIFGSTDLIQSISAIPSAILSKTMGPVKATLAAQIPCGIFFALIPILGSTLPRATTLYLLNQATTAFDVVPRQVLLTSLVDPNDITKVMGTVNIGKQIARSISPCFTGMFAQRGLLWVCFLINGSLLILANVILGFMFRGVDDKVNKTQAVEHDIEA